MHVCHGHHATSELLVARLGTYLRVAAGLLALWPVPAFAAESFASEVIIRADRVIGADLAGVPSTTRVNSEPELICSGVLLVDAPPCPLPLDVMGSSAEASDWSGLVLEQVPVVQGDREQTPDHAEASIRMDEPAAEGLEVAELRSIRPNPSRATMVIAFTLAHDSETAVSLDVFDVAGRRVAYLLDRRITAGSHEVEWSGSGQDGERVAPGIYFVRLKVGEIQRTRRTVLLD